MIFNKKPAEKKEVDPHAKLINRILMLGLVAFVAFSVLSEKRALDKTIYVWNAEVSNLTNNKQENIKITEGNEVALTLNRKELEEFLAKNKTETGNLEVFKLKLNLLPVKEDSKITSKPATP